MEAGVTSAIWAAQALVSGPDLLSVIVFAACIFAVTALVFLSRRRTAQVELARLGVHIADAIGLAPRPGSDPNTTCFGGTFGALDLSVTQRMGELQIRIQPAGDPTSVAVARDFSITPRDGSLDAEGVITGHAWIDARYQITGDSWGAWLLIGPDLRDTLYDAPEEVDLEVTGAMIDMVLRLPRRASSAEIPEITRMEGLIQWASEVAWRLYARAATVAADNEGALLLQELERYDEVERATLVGVLQERIEMPGTREILRALATHADIETRVRAATTLDEPDLERWLNAISAGTGPRAGLNLADADRGATLLARLRSTPPHTREPEAGA